MQFFYFMIKSYILILSNIQIRIWNKFLKVTFDVRSTRSVFDDLIAWFILLYIIIYHLDSNSWVEPISTIAYH